MSTGQVTPPIRPSGQGSGQGFSIVNIVEIPEALENNTKTLRLEGKITQSNSNNGTARIETQYGSIDIKVRGRQAPSEGQRVIVEVPAGRPPRQVAIQADRSAPAQNTNQAQNTQASQNVAPTVTNDRNPQLQVPRTQAAQPSLNAPASAQQTSQQTINPPPTNYQPVAQNGAQNGNASTPQTIQNSTRQTLPPLPTDIQAALNRNISTTAVTAQSQTIPLAVDNIVRLIPIPPAQAHASAINFSQTLTAIPATLSNSSLNSNLSVPISSLSTLSGQTGLQTLAPLTTTPNLTLGTFSQTTLTAPNATATNLVQQTTIAPTQIIPQAQTVPLLSAEAFLAQGSQTAIASQGSSSAATIGATTTLSSVSIPTSTPSSLNATLTPVPINFDPANTASFLQPRSTSIDIQINKITPPNAVLTTPPTTGLNTAPPIPATTPFTPALLSGNNAVTLTAQVTGFTAQGLPLITVQSAGNSLPQSFILQHNSSNLALGTQLQITARPPIGLPAVTPQNINPLLQGFQWPAMDDLFNGLLQLSPQAAASLTRSLPSPANALQIAPAAMMFIAAVKAGDIGQFLGQQKIDLLQNAGKESILSRLTSGGGAAQAAVPEAQSSSDWRAVPLPMFWEGEIHRVTLYTRNESQQKQRDDENGGQTRFVFDLSLSRMGEVQIDGLLRDERLDLVVRTHHAFTEPMQQTMRQAYSAALNQTDLSGELNFQGAEKHWVHVLEKNEQLGVDA